MKNLCPLLLIMVIAGLMIYSCSSQSSIYEEPRYEILSEKIYQGERTSALLQKFIDTASILVNKKGIPESSVSRAMLLYLPDTTYKDLRKPNPFGPILKYYFAIKTPAYITMFLKIAENDSNGYIILQDSLSEGSYLLSFRNCNLESGLYYLQFENIDTVVQKKAVFIK